MGYPGMGSGPVPGEALQPPRQLVTSRMLWVASCVVGLVAVILRLADRRMLSDMLTQMAPGITLAQVDGAVNFVVVLTVLLRLLLIWVFWSLATRMLHGVEWARLVLTVIGGIGVGFGLLGMIGVLGGAASSLGFTQIAFAAAVLALDIAALAMMLHPNSRAFFIGVRKTRPGNTPA